MYDRLKIMECCSEKKFGVWVYFRMGASATTKIYFFAHVQGQIELFDKKFRSKNVYSVTFTEILQSSSVT